jgi:hypothetical protein
METKPEFVTTQKYEKLTKLLESMSLKMNAIEAALKAQNSRMGEIEQKMPTSSTDIDTWEGFGPKPERQPFNPNAETYTLELHHGPYTIRRDDGESDKEWQRRKDHLMDQRVTFLNGSGQNGTPEQVAYLQRIEARLGRKISQHSLATT